jgi:hypothetical protein
VLESFRAISRVTFELIGNFSEISSVSIIRFGEWTCVADIYTSLWNIFLSLLMYYAVRGRSQTVRSPIQLLTMHHVAEAGVYCQTIFPLFLVLPFLCILGFLVLYIFWNVLINRCWDFMRSWPSFKPFFRHLLLGSEEDYENPQLGRYSKRAPPKHKPQLTSSIRMVIDWIPTVKTMECTLSIAWSGSLLTDFVITALRAFILLLSAELKTVPRYGRNAKHFLLDYSFWIWLLKWTSLCFCTAI